MRLTVALSLLFGVLVAATPVRREDDFQDEDDVFNDPENREEDEVTEDEDIAEEDPADYAEESETEDESEKNQEIEREDEPQYNDAEEQDVSGFNCTGRNSTKPDGTTIKYADPDSCHHWYDCLNGATRYGCHPSSLIFSEPDQKCVTGTGCTPSPFSCNGKPDGNYQDQTNCGKYISCSNDIKHEMSCPSGLYYNPPNDQCDYPANVNLITYPCTAP